MQTPSRWFWCILLLVSTFTFIAPLRAQDDDSKKKEVHFGFRFLGPQVGNRISAVAGIPGDPSTYYAGAASGGVWKSTDGGNNWSPIFDDQPVQAIGALAVGPSDHSVIWAGTGEAWAIRDSDVTGNGIYKSTDAGKTWTHMGLDETGRIGRIIVDPKNSDVVFACAAGRLTGPQQERGVYRTNDGGQHWERVLFVNEDTGCSGLTMDPQNSRTLFAGMWQVVMHTWGEFSGGPGSSVWVSHDGGSKWERIEDKGLPKPPVGKIDVAVAPTDSNRVYALIQTADQGSLWRSDDGGKSWKVVNWSRALIGRAGYYIRLAVSPKDENEVFVANSSFHRSLDGGETFRETEWGGDNHDIWIDPQNADRFAISFDGGLIITTTHGRGFQFETLPVGQMYHVAVDNQIPYYVYGNMQDDGTMRGPSIRAYTDEEGDDLWNHHMGGCESGFTLPDLEDPNVVWATCYGDEVTRWDARTHLARSVSPYLHTLDSPPNDVKYRCHWTPPLAIDPFDHNTVYYGCQVIFKTSNAGQSWSVISPDLSSQDPSRVVSSGGIVGDNLGQFYGEVVFAIAPSTIQKGLIWAGTNDGKLWYTKDGGANWNDVTKNLAHLPPWGTVTSIQPSVFDAGTAYVSIDFHLVDNRDPFIFKTTDFGQTWSKISDGIPKGPLSYIRVIAEDPNARGLLFAGSGNALYYSLDDGKKWTEMKEGLPHATVSWAVVQKNFHDLVVSTYGRGFYILDDISPLEHLAKEASSDAAVRFFAPRSAYRFVRNANAYLTFNLKNAPKKKPEIDIFDANNKVVRHLDGEAKAGMNRFAWDLRYEGPKLVQLRTVPAANPHVWQEPRFWDKDARPATHWGLDEKQSGPLAAPGKYTVKLTVDGQSLTEPLEVLKDPRATGSDADINQSVQTQLRIRDDISKAADIVNSLEWSRKQLADVGAMLKDQKAKPEVVKNVTDMDDKMQALEYKVVSKALTMSDDKYFSENHKLYFDLLWLDAEVGSGAGDVAGGADYRPTDTSLALLDQLEGQLKTAEAEFHDLVQQQLPQFNRAMIENGVTPVVAAPSGGSGTQPQ